MIIMTSVWQVFNILTSVQQVFGEDWRRKWKLSITYMVNKCSRKDFRSFHFNRNLKKKEKKMRFDRSLYGGTTNFGRRRHKDLQGAKIRFRGTEYKRKDATSVKIRSFYFSYLLQLRTDFGLVNKNLYKRVTTSSIFGSTSDWPIEPLIHRKLGEASLLHPTRWKPSLLDPTG